MVAAAVFQVDTDGIDLAMTPNDIEKWDSLNHLRLITAVEREFNVRLSMNQILAVECLGDLNNYIEEGV